MRRKERQTIKIRTKIGEVTGKTLFRVEGSSGCWYSSEFMAKECFRNNQLIHEANTRKEAVHEPIK